MTRRIGRNSDDNEVHHQVVDFNQAREQRLTEKRKATERIFFNNLLSVYFVMSRNKLVPIEMIDVSEEGCSFQIPDTNAKGRELIITSSELPIRFYFSQNTYLEIQVNIENSSPCIQNGARYVRYGCLVDESFKSYLAYQQFVRFLKLYSVHAHKDLGDVSIFYL